MASTSRYVDPIRIKCIQDHEHTVPIAFVEDYVTKNVDEMDDEEAKLVERHRILKCLSNKRYYLPEKKRKYLASAAIIPERMKVMSFNNNFKRFNISTTPEDFNRHLNQKLSRIGLINNSIAGIVSGLIKNSLNTSVDRELVASLNSLTYDIRQVSSYVVKEFHINTLLLDSFVSCPIPSNQDIQELMNKMKLSGFTKKTTFVQ